MDSNLKPGQIVRYSRPEQGEGYLRFVVLENNGDRVQIESLDFPDWRVKPTEVVAIDEVVIAEESR
jgi:hypothetical protein